MKPDPAEIPEFDAVMRGLVGVNPDELTDTVRQATRDEAISFIARAAGDDALSPVVEPDRIKACDEFWAAESDSQIVGVACIATAGWGQRPGVHVLETVFVRNSDRGRGVGSLVVESALRSFIGQGKTPIHCDVVSQGMGRILASLPEEITKHVTEHSA